MFGGNDDERINVFPDYGMGQGGFAGVVRGQTAKVGDSVVFRGTQKEENELKAVIESLAKRKTITLEILMLDMTDDEFERLNGWLDQLSLSAGYVAREQVFDGLGSGLGVLVPNGAGPVWDVNIKGVLTLLDTFKSGKVELREQIQILSGAESVFSSGQVVETPLILREPQTGDDLVTRIERRNIGLDMTIGATHADGDWFIDLDVSDSSMQNGLELTTSLQTQKRIRQGTRGSFQLASFTRKSIGDSKKAVPGLSRIPKVGRLFKKEDTQKSARQVVIFGQVLDVY